MGLKNMVMEEKFMGGTGTSKKWKGATKYYKELKECHQMLTDHFEKKEKRSKVYSEKLKVRG